MKSYIGQGAEGSQHRRFGGAACTALPAQEYAQNLSKPRCLGFFSGGFTM